MRKIDPFEYIRNAYGLAFHKGQRVRCGDREEVGVVVTADHHVHVRIDGVKHTVPYHPSDVHPESP